MRESLLDSSRFKIHVSKFTFSPLPSLLHPTLHPTQQRVILRCTDRLGANHCASVWAAGQSYHLDWAAVDLEHGVKLFGLLGRAAIIGFALNEQRGRFAAMGVGDGRTAGVDFRNFVRMSAQLCHCKPGSNVADAIEAQPIGDGILAQPP